MRTVMLWLVPPRSSLHRLQNAEIFTSVQWGVSDWLLEVGDIWTHMVHMYIPTIVCRSSGCFFSGAHKVVVMQFCWLRCTVALCDVRSLIESALHHPRKMQGGVYVLYHGYQRQLPAGWWKLAYSAASNSSIRTIPSEWWSVWYFSCIAYCSFCLA